MLLSGKTAVISGAASARGIGRATAKLFAEHGARVAIFDLDQAASETAATELPGEGHIGVACNVTDKHSCTEAAAQAIEAFGRVDILINNAGITQPIKTLDIDADNWKTVIDVNLTGVLLLSQALIPHMREEAAARSPACRRFRRSAAAVSSAVRIIRRRRPECSASPRRWPANSDPTTFASIR